MPLPLALSMVIAARARALRVVGVSREAWLLFACLLEVGFFALLRPGELLNLKACDVGYAQQPVAWSSAMHFAHQLPEESQKLGT